MTAPHSADRALAATGHPGTESIPPVPGARRVVVVGSGPAGYMAAASLARSGLTTVMLEGSRHRCAELIWGLDPRAQAQRFGVRLLPVDADAVSLAGDVKTFTAGGTAHQADAVVLATGAAARHLEVPGAVELTGRGVSYCAARDGFFFKGQNVAVVGDGDAALEAATFLTHFAKSVTVIHRSGNFRASNVMLRRAHEDPKIQWAAGYRVRKLGGDGQLQWIELGGTLTRDIIRRPFAGLFVAIGHVPRSELFAGHIDLEPDGYVAVGRGGYQTGTSAPGVFACGDLVDSTYRQAVTAAGSGVAAALDVGRYLAGLHQTTPAG